MPRISLPLRGSSDTFDGMYIPPSAEAAINIVEYLTVTQNQVQNDDGQVLNHLLVGDFNQYTWNDKSDDLFQEWLGESGTWELSESSVPTRPIIVLSDDTGLLDNEAHCVKCGKFVGCSE